jgi:hypothetical protein
VWFGERWSTKRDEDLLELVRDRGLPQQRICWTVRYDAVLAVGTLKWWGHTCFRGYVDWGRILHITFVSFYCRLRFDPYKRGIKLAMVFLASLCCLEMLLLHNMTRIIISGACRFPAIGIQLNDKSPLADGPMGCQTAAPLNAHSVEYRSTAVWTSCVYGFRDQAPSICLTDITSVLFTSGILPPLAWP